MLPGIPDTPNNKKMLLSVLKCPGGRGNSFARKDLGVGNKFCYVRVDTSFTEKRDRAGTKTKTYRFVVSLKVEEAPNPPLRRFSKFVGAPYRNEVGDDPDALWDAVCGAMQIQAHAPGCLCVHCHGYLTWPDSDTCPKCSLGLQDDFQACEENGATATREADRKTPRPRQG